MHYDQLHLHLQLSFAMPAVVWTTLSAIPLALLVGFGLVLLARVTFSAMQARGIHIV